MPRWRASTGSVADAENVRGGKNTVGQRRVFVQIQARHDAGALAVAIAALRAHHNALGVGGREHRERGQTVRAGTGFARRQ